MSDNTHPCDYAFPVAPGDVAYWQPGMTLRDWFAGQVINGIYAGRGGPIQSVLIKEDTQLAYGIADAMLEARYTSQETKKETDGST